MQKQMHADFPEYLIREDGLVERIVDSRRYQKAGSILSGRILVSGYRQFKLCDRTGKRRLVRANRLVCEAFHGAPPSPKHQAAHKNGKQDDNRADNLYWATGKENCADKVTHGTACRGERAVNQYGPAKLDSATVLAIRAEYTGRRGQIREMERRYGVSWNAIKNVLSGTTWQHVKSETEPARFGNHGSPPQERSIAKG